jgi:site-specific recombinase XerD
VDLKAGDFSKEGSFLLIKISGSKGGLPRTIRLRLALPLVQELYKYITTCHPDLYLFHPFRSNYVKTFLGKTGKELIRKEKTAKLRYYFKKWFSSVIAGGINPYYLRHNRLSKLSEAGVTMEDIRQFKGCKTFASITPYIHMSKHKSVSLARKIN